MVASKNDKTVKEKFNIIHLIIAGICTGAVLFFVLLPMKEHATAAVGMAFLNEVTTSSTAPDKIISIDGTDLPSMLSVKRQALDVESPSDMSQIEIIDDCSPESIWCCSKIPMMKKSLYGFPDLVDSERWLRSCRVAATDKQILLPHVLKEHTSPYDFIDGDTAFTLLHKQVDEFMDVATGFIGRMKPTDKIKMPVVPVSYGHFYERTDFTQQNLLNRVPIIMSAFMSYSGSGKDFLKGKFLGYRGLVLRQILEHWEKQKSQIDMKERFILVTPLNENWGFLSTGFPNRTSMWGRVDDVKFPNLMSFLDDPRLVMLVINQHSNYSHPKLLTLPR